MKKPRIFKIFRLFHGSGRFAAQRLGVSRATISHWLRDTKTSARLDAEMPKLAEEIVRTRGKCIKDLNDVDGPSVRSQIRRLRKKDRPDAR